MEIIGIQFCFYPILILMGIVSLLLGFVHLFLCLPFFFLAAGIVNGIILLVTAFHGCFLVYPTRGHIGSYGKRIGYHRTVRQVRHRARYDWGHTVLHVTGMLWALALAILCSLEFFCVLPDEQRTKPFENSVCFGLRQRTWSLAESCIVSVGGFRGSVRKLFWSLSEANVERLVTGGQAGIGALQAALCGGMGWYCALETSMRPRAYHFQIILAFIIAIFGCIHTLFCCMYFYVGFAVWTAAIVLIQAVVTLKTKGASRISRVINLAGAGLGMALTAINSFGLFCWFESLHRGNDWAFMYHCRYRPDTYHWCERRIEFASTYTHWPAHIVKLSAYIGLIVCGVLQLLISIHSMFRKIRPP